MALPGEVSYGHVTGRFLLAVADGVDPDTYPDSQPAQGSVTFRPSVSLVRFPGSPAIVLPQEIVCTVDEEGYLLDEQGERGVYLVATDDVDGNPTDWTYTVELDFGGALIPPFSIQVPTDSDQDLSALVPVDESPGVITIQGPPGAGLNIIDSLDSETELPSTGFPGDAYLVAGDLWVWAATDEWKNVGRIEGPQGVQGETGPANVLTIGTVETGTESSATITGSSPSQVLNLVLEKGDKGDKGDTGDTGPQGEQGEPGPANSLSIGTVSSGETAAASITGDAPNQTLDLTLPVGPQGPEGPEGPEGPAADRPIVDLGSVSGTVALDASTAGMIARATLTGDTSFTLTTPPADGNERVITLIATQDGTGGRTITLPSTVLWAHGVDYISMAPANTVDMIHLVWDGVAWYAVVGAIGMMTV